MCSLPCEFLIWHTIFDNLAVNVNFSLSEFIIIFLILSKNTLFKNYDSRIINKYFWGNLIYFLRVKNQLKHRKHLIKKIMKFRFYRKKLSPKNNDYFFDFQQIYFHDIHESIERYHPVWTGVLKDTPLFVWPPAEHISVSAKNN